MTRIVGRVDVGGCVDDGWAGVTTVSGNVGEACEDGGEQGYCFMEEGKSCAPVDVSGENGGGRRAPVRCRGFFNPARTRACAARTARPCAPHGRGEGGGGWLSDTVRALTGRRRGGGGLSDRARGCVLAERATARGGCPHHPAVLTPRHPRGWGEKGELSVRAFLPGLSNAATAACDPSSAQCPWSAKLSTRPSGRGHWGGARLPSPAASRWMCHRRGRPEQHASPQPLHKACAPGVRRSD